MTYNVHSCIGTDGRVSSRRITEVIRQVEPDVVALQELDSGLVRTGLVDQAHLIADALKMDCQFFPCLRIEKGQYGNAVFSRLPMRLVQASELPTLPQRPNFEKRGALWVEIELPSSKIQFLNTHLGLNQTERLAQVKDLLSDKWLGHLDCRPPVILAGDFNISPLSRAYRRLRGVLWDAGRHLHPLNPRRTWPSRFPLLRLDYIFVTSDFIVKKTRVLHTPLTRIASDHLPLNVELEFSPPRLLGERIE